MASQLVKRIAVRDSMAAYLSRAEADGSWDDVHALRRYLEDTAVLDQLSAHLDTDPDGHLTLSDVALDAFFQNR